MFTVVGDDKVTLWKLIHCIHRRSGPDHHPDECARVRPEVVRKEGARARVDTLEAANCPLGLTPARNNMLRQRETMQRPLTPPFERPEAPRAGQSPETFGGAKASPSDAQSCPSGTEPFLIEQYSN